MLRYRKLTDTTAEAMFIGSGVKDGDHIALTFPQGDVAFEASKVKYERDPQDMFSCKLTVLGLIESE